MTYISDGFVDGFESRLLLVVIHAPVAVNHCDPMLIGALCSCWSTCSDPDGNSTHSYTRTGPLHNGREKRSKGGDIYKNYEK